MLVVGANITSLRIFLVISAFVISPFLAFSQTDTTKTIPYKSYQDKDFSFTETISAAASSDGIIVLYNGINKQKMKQVLLGAGDANALGIPVKALLVGPFDPNFLDGKKDSFVIYFLGTKITKRGSPGDHHIRKLICELIKDSYQKSK